MYRKLVIIAVAFCTLAIGACVPVTPGSGPAVTPISTGDPTIDQAVATAQSYAVEACGFLPTVNTVTGILATFVAGAAPIQSVAIQIAQGICNAVNNKGYHRGMKRKLKYRGVTIQGQLVR